MPPKICCLKKLRNATWQIPFRFGYQRYRPHAKPAPAAKAQVWIWYTQPKTNIFPENWWLEDDLPFNIFRFSADMLISRVYISGLCWIRATRATELEAASKFHHVGWQNLKTEHPCQQHASCKGSTLSPTFTNVIGVKIHPARMRKKIKIMFVIVKVDEGCSLQVFVMFFQSLFHWLHFKFPACPRRTGGTTGSSLAFDCSHWCMRDAWACCMVEDEVDMGHG